jgi:hypothetical protein
MHILLRRVAETQALIALVCTHCGPLLLQAVVILQQQQHVKATLYVKNAAQYRLHLASTYVQQTGRIPNDIPLRTSAKRHLEDESALLLKQL